MTEMGLEDLILAFATFNKKISIKEISESTGIHRSIISRIINSPRSSIKTEHLDKLLNFFYIYLKSIFDEIDSEIPSLLEQYESGSFRKENTDSRGELVFKSGASFEDVYSEFKDLFPSEDGNPKLRDRAICDWVISRLIQFFPNNELNKSGKLTEKDIQKIDFDIPTLWYRHTGDLASVFDFSDRTREK